MRILHISGGLPPKRVGGLVAYVQELIEAQRKRGYEIIYIDTGNYSAWPGARVVKASGPADYKIVNAGGLFPQFYKTLEPLRQVACSRRLGKKITKLMKKLDPQIIHVHEMIGLPAELIPLLHDQGYKIIFTAQDYFTLCPTIKLVTINGDLCNLPDNELICKKCCADANFAFEEPALEFLSWLSRWHLVEYFARAVFARTLWPAARKLQKYAVTDEKYIQRRKRFRDCMSSFDRIICMSKAQMTEMRRVLGPLPRMELQYLSRQTYDDPTSARARSGDGPVIFVALNVTSPEKGLNLLLESVDQLREFTGKFQLHMYGADGIDDDVIKWKGKYTERQLDEISVSADCAIIPSLWWECYGYVGPEMLTRGVPLIVSSLGGMHEYVTHEENGLIFDPKITGQLAAWMRRLIENRSLLVGMRNRTVENRPGIVHFGMHLDALELLYHDVLKSPQPIGA